MTFSHRNNRIAVILLAAGCASFAIAAGAQRAILDADTDRRIHLPRAKTQMRKEIRNEQKQAQRRNASWTVPLRSGMPAAPSSVKRISFLNDIEPILTRAGCNQGACHGSQFGKGGFKLSLAAYDPQWDHESIVRQSSGRRISPAAPLSSLVLRKAALELPHSGGLKIPRGSGDYAVIARWLREGAPGPNSADAHITALEATPTRKILHPGEQVQLTVRAWYSDGTVRDVTAHTRINSLNDKIAAVTPEGRASALDHGATAIMLRYDGLATVSHVVVPYVAVSRAEPQPVRNSGVSRKGAKAQRNARRDESPLTNSLVASRHGHRTPQPTHPLSEMAPSFIDNRIAGQWRELGLEPSGPCTDSEFVRRVSLDIIGTLPSAEEAREFATDTTPGKDSRLIDRLLARPEYADCWAEKWGDLLRNSRTTLGDKAMWSFRNWIRDSLLHNRPYDRFVHDMITAQGGAFSEPASNYYRTAPAPLDVSEATAQVFLGVRLQCAKCHHHPFEKWSQNDYYQFAAFFARVGGKENREPGGATVEPTVRLLSEGEILHPKTGVRMTPTPLALQDGPALSPNAADPDLTGDRRKLLADWLTGPDNRLFAKMVVNRYWAHFLGRGIVQPVDDMRVTNPPSNPGLLDALADDFTARGSDLKRLIATICTSRAYRLSSRPTAANRADAVFFSHFLERRQPAEVLLDSIDIAAGTHEKYAGLPVGTRAIQLPDASVASSFLDTFGRPPRSTSCECERSAEPSLSQSLQLLNGELVQRKVTDPTGRAALLAASGRTGAQIVESLYYSALSRPPRSTERRMAERALAAAPSLRQGAEDLLWALINAREFGAIK